MSIQKYIKMIIKKSNNKTEKNEYNKYKKNIKETIKQIRKKNIKT